MNMTNDRLIFGAIYKITMKDGSTHHGAAYEAGGETLLIVSALEKALIQDVAPINSKSIFSDIGNALNSAANAIVGAMVGTVSTAGNVASTFGQVVASSAGDASNALGIPGMAKSFNFNEPEAYFDIYGEIVRRSSPSNPPPGNEIHWHSPGCPCADCKGISEHGHWSYKHP